jgi:protoheme IX farnesyltransferase
MSVRQIQAEKVFNFIGLCKMKIAFFSALSAVTGLFCAPNYDLLNISFLFGGIFSLAAGSSSLNQYQEKDIDALMPRTAGRPIPSGRIEAHQARSFSFILIGTGLLILTAGISLAAAMLGLATVLWYNVVYTFLKKKSACAMVPGAFTGIMPPVIGWIAGGGVLPSPPLLYLSFFIFLWQIAHSLLVVREYGKEFEAAGLPSLTTIFTPRQLSRIASNWIFAVAITFLLLPLFVSPYPSYLWFAILPVVFLWLTVSAVQLLQGGVFAYTVLFKKLHGVLSIILIALTIQESLRKILSGAISR